MAPDPTPSRRNGDTSLLPDPSENVKDALSRAIMRLDDLASLRQKRADELREAESRRVNEQMELRTDYENKLKEAESRRIDEQMVLRSSHEEQLRQAEANRINAIRLVDTQAVATANERAAAQATVLANQVAASAETLRALVASTASTVAQQQAALATQLGERIATLERTSYTGQGKESQTDPAIAQLTAAVASLVAAQNTVTGRGLGAAQVVAYIIAGIGVLGTIVAIGFAILKP